MIYYANLPEVVYYSPDNGRYTPPPLTLTEIREFLYPDFDGCADYQTFSLNKRWSTGTMWTTLRRIAWRAAVPA
jgi:hypothetical protein